MTLSRRSLVVFAALLAAAPACAAPTEVRVLAVLVDVPGRKPRLQTREQVAAALFGADDSTAARLRETSYGRFALSGTVADVVGPFTLDEPGDFCRSGYQKLADAADAAARAAGVDVAPYDHVAYVMPPDMPCWWTGLGIIGGRRVWVKAATARAFQHELGHNLGMNHALNWTRSASEDSDFMGTSSYGLNAPHLVQLHWLDAFPGKVVEFATARELDLETLEEDPQASRLPKIAIVKPSESGNVYYLSYRRAAPGRPLSDDDTRGVNIHVYDGAARDSGFTRFVRALSDGETFMDGPLRVRQLSHAVGSRVRVAVDWDGAGEALAAGPPPSAAGTIQSLSSGKCLDVARGSKDDGAPVIQYACHAGLNQRWRVVPRGEDAFELVNAASGKCLQVRGGAAAAGAPVVQGACAGRDDQLWIPEASSSGRTLKSAASGLCLDLPRASADDGVQPALWKCLGGPNQQWRLDDR